MPSRWISSYLDAQYSRIMLMAGRTVTVRSFWDWCHLHALLWIGEILSTFHMSGNTPELIDQLVRAVRGGINTLPANFSILVLMPLCCFVGVHGCYGLQHKTLSDRWNLKPGCVVYTPSHVGPSKWFVQMDTVLIEAVSNNISILVE